MCERRHSLSPEEQELLRRCQAGEEAAYRELMRLHERRVYRLALGILGTPADAAEGVQEAFIKVFRSIRNFRGDSQLYTWIYRIARNACIDVKRRQKSRNEVEYMDELITDPHGAAGSGQIPLQPHHALEQKELGAQLHAAIAQLPEAQREIFLLRELDGLSYEQLSETLQISKGTVMSRLFLARRKLQQSLTGRKRERGAS